ncbi:MAG: hypothetical protein E5V88_29200, partial [Mesorhizobium sp.]
MLGRNLVFLDLRAARHDHRLELWLLRLLRHRIDQRGGACLCARGDRAAEGGDGGEPIVAGAGVGGFITPGDRVDVVLTRDAGEIQEVAK